MISKNLLAKIALILIVGSSVIIPMVSLAAVDANGNPVTYQTPSLWPTGFWGPLVSCTGYYVNSGPGGIGQGQVSVNGTGQPPPSCTSLCDLIDTVINIIYFVLSIAIFVITPLGFVVGSIMLMVAGANPEMLATGKRVLKGVVIGLIIVLCSYLIVQTVISVLNITGIGGFGTSTCSVTS